MQSYNPSAWRSQGGYNDPSNNQQAGPSMYRHQPMGTVPEMRHPHMPSSRSNSEGPLPPPIPPLPPSLTPGRQRGISAASSVHSNFFFDQPSGYEFPTPRHPPRHTHSYTAGVPLNSPPVPIRPWQSPQISSAPSIPPHPNSIAFKDSYVSPPTLPPKLSFYSQSVSGFTTPGFANEPFPLEGIRPFASPPSANESFPLETPKHVHPQAMPTAPQSPSEAPKTVESNTVSHEEEEAFALAIAQSIEQSKLERTQLTDEQREDEELRRVLEQSRLESQMASGTSAMSLPIAVEVPPSESTTLGDLEPSRVRSLPTSPIPSSSHLGDNFAGESTDSGFPFTSSPQMLQTQISDDETFARRLAAGGEDSPSDVSNSNPQERISFPMPQIPQTPQLPLYSPTISGIAQPPAARLHASSSTWSTEHPTLPRPESMPENSLSRDNSVRSATSQHSAVTDALSRLSVTSPESSASPGTRPISFAVPPSISAPMTVGSDSQSRPSPTNHGLDDSSAFSPPTRPLSSQAMLPVQTSISEKPRPVSMLPGTTASPGDAIQGFSAHQFVERELLQGISLGFTPPAISTMMEPMQGPMPNIITLPFGKSPPLHIQAPSWRHLLKLMARLSGTRIEPTTEAIAITRGELKLRTVVQFVKLHRSSSDWRTILYLSLDYPVPTSAPNSWKYSNSDVNTLPYSYTLSTLPTLLREGADNSLSTYYTIPSTARTPFPTLPIAFPDMAMYLQSAIDDSRRAMHDSSSGLRKLAKSVDLNYPNSGTGGIEDAPDKKGFWRFGRNKNKNNRGGNEEVFEYVTPFLAEGY